MRTPVRQEGGVRSPHTIRVLIVDDSAVARRVLRGPLDAAPDVEVVGEAVNGREALVQTARLRPDVITLDVEMPELDGIETLEVLSECHPEIKVIMVSALTQRGSARTVDALMLGAADYVSKPTKANDRADALDDLGCQVLDRIRALIEPRPPRPPRPTNAPGLIVIGTSTGGPAALNRVLTALPGGLPVPIVVAQHMPDNFTKALAYRLGRDTHLPVREIVHDQPLPATGVCIAPGGHHLQLVRRDGVVRFETTPSPLKDGARPSIDLLLSTATELYGHQLFAVILTGMGCDGLKGCQALRTAGGYVIVQDEATSVVWGMPGAVQMAGLAHECLPLEEIAPAIERVVAGATSRLAPS